MGARTEADKSIYRVDLLLKNDFTQTKTPEMSSLDPKTSIMMHNMPLHDRKIIFAIF